MLIVIGRSLCLGVVTVAIIIVGLIGSFTAAAASEIAVCADHELVLDMIAQVVLNIR